MAASEDPFFADLLPQHADAARAGDEEDEIRLPAFAARFPRLDTDWIPLRWQPETLTLTPPFRDALSGLLTRQDAAADAILAAIAAALPKLSETYGEDLAAVYGDRLADALVPRAVTFHAVGDTVLTGVELDCDWDPESGLGLLLRDDRVLGVGFADVAFSAGVVEVVAGGETKPFLWTP